MKPRVIKPGPDGEAWFEEGCFVTESSNTPCDPALSIARVRVAARTGTRWHYLDVDERYIVVEGAGIMDMEGAPSTEVVPGDVVVVPAGCSQRIRATSDRDLVVYCLCTPRFTPDVYHDAEERNPS